MYSYEVFERLLTEKGVRAADVARATGISTATLSSWKNGKYTPKADKLQLIADYFDVPVNAFAEGKIKKLTVTFHKRNGTAEKHSGEYIDWIGQLATDFTKSVLDEFEWKLLDSYKAADTGTRAAVRKLLDIQDEDTMPVHDEEPEELEADTDYLEPVAAHAHDGATPEELEEDLRIAESDD